MTVCSHPVDGPVEAEAPPPPEVLFREARRRRRRRYGVGALLLAGASVFVVGVVTFSASPPPPRPPVGLSASPSDGFAVSAHNGARVRSIDLGGFIPDNIVSLDHRIWLLGSDDTTGSSAPAMRCSVEEFDPASMRRLRMYPLASCGDDVASGGGDVYLAVITDERATNTETVRLERFDPTTGRSTVMQPTVMTLSGSSRAHCELAYADGSVWFWGSGAPGTASDGLVRISPSSGSVLQTFVSSSLPLPGSPRNVLTGQGDELWLGGEAAGGREVIDVLSPGQRVPRTVYSTGRDVQWMSTVGDDVWAYVYTDPGHAQLLEFDAHGSLVDTFAAAPVLNGGGVVTSGALWASGEGNLCSDPARLWRISRGNGKAIALLAVHAPYDTCLGSTGAAATDHFAFTFLAEQGVASRLFRVGVPAVKPAE